MTRQSQRFSLGLLGCLFAMPGFTEPVNLEAGVSTRFSDNIRLDDRQEKNDLETTFDVGIRHQTDPGICHSNLNANLAFLNYLDNSFDDETQVTLDWAGDCEILDRLIWRASESIRELQRNPQAANTVDERDTRNIFTTGPEYTWLLSQTDSLIFSYEVQRSQFDSQTEDDADRQITSSRWLHVYDPTLTIGLSLSADRADLDSGEEIDTNAYNLTFDKGFKATQISGSFGFSTLDNQINGTSQSTEGVVWSLRLDRQIDRATRWYFAYERELTDSTSNQDLQIAGLTFNFTQTNAIELTHYETGLTHAFADTSALSLVLAREEQSFLASGFNENTNRARLAYSRPVAQRITLDTGLSYRQNTFDIDNTEDDIYDLDLGVNWQYTRPLLFTGRIGVSQKNSDVENREYTEHWISLGVRYAY